MRKMLVALLSVVGLAGSNVPAGAQVLKGSKQEDVKAQSKIKESKGKQEKAAAASHTHIKMQKSGAEANAAKADAHVKGEKSAADAHAAKPAAQIKLDKAKADKAGQAK